MNLGQISIPKRLNRWSPGETCLWVPKSVRPGGTRESHPSAVMALNPEMIEIGDSSG